MSARSQITPPLTRSLTHSRSECKLTFRVQPTSPNSGCAVWNVPPLCRVLTHRQDRLADALPLLHIEHFVSARMVKMTYGVVVSLATSRQIQNLSLAATARKFFRETGSWYPAHLVPSSPKYVIPSVPRAAFDNLTVQGTRIRDNLKEVAKNCTRNHYTPSVDVSRRKWYICKYSRSWTSTYTAAQSCRKGTSRCH